MTLEQLLQLLSMAAGAVDHIFETRASRAAEETLRALTAVYGAVKDATTAHVTPQQARTQIAALIGALEANDKAADAALAAKFPRGEEDGKDP